MENVEGAQIATLVTKALPRFMVLKSIYNGKYLNCVNEEGETHAFLKFSGEDALSPLAKFELEPAAQSGSGQLFHIRSCYNNKYWRMKVDGDWYVDAVGDQPEEDRSKWSCTLFEAISLDEAAQTWRFRHAFRGGYACLWRAEEPRSACLYAGYSDTNSDLCDVYTTVNWESFTILPKHVAFKGDNGKYLKCFWKDQLPYLEFYGNDIGDEKVGNEIFTNGDGTIRIKSDHFGKFWRRSPNWIWADSTDTTSNDMDTLFRPVIIDYDVAKNVIALRNLGNNYFCESLSVDRKENCLNANVPNITQKARLEVEELILSKSIYHVCYRFADARIYDQIPVHLAEVPVVNDKDVTDTVTTKQTYTDVRTRCWNSSLSLKESIEFNLQIGVPGVSAGKLTRSFEYVKEQAWGETKILDDEVEMEYAVAVPPRTSVTVKLMATRGMCEVPFSYSQRVTLTNGQQRIEKKDDGVYKGSNYFNFHIITTQHKI